MPNTALTEAIKEAYASCPTDEVELPTLEIFHPSANGGVPFYLVRDVEDHILNIEGGIPKNFEACAFRFRLPPSGQNGAQRLQLEIDNADKRIGKFFDSVIDSNVAVEMIFRPYLASDPNPQMNPPLQLNLRDVRISNVVTGTATALEIVNAKFPSENYTRKRFRGLANL